MTEQHSVGNSKIDHNVVKDLNVLRISCFCFFSIGPDKDRKQDINITLKRNVFANDVDGLLSVCLQIWLAVLRPNINTNLL